MQINDLRLSTYQAAAPANSAFRAPSESEGLPSARAEPVDSISISKAALRAAASATAQAASGGLDASAVSKGCADCAAGVCTTCSDDTKPAELSEEEEAKVKELKERDQEVRAHEAAHASTGGSFAGSPSYEYETGPDGKRYAVGGEVNIDTAPVEGDPNATIDKLRTVQAAALAPAEPSDQDRKVAQQAAAQIREAEAELAAQKRDEISGEAPPNEAVETANNAASSGLEAIGPFATSLSSNTDTKPAATTRPNDDQDLAARRADRFNQTANATQALFLNASSHSEDFTNPAIFAQQRQQAAGAYEKIAALA